MSEEKNKLTKEISNLKNEIKKLKEENESLKFNSSNFQEFLAKSYLTPKFLAPFSNEEKQVFAFMDYISEYLRSNVSKNEYSPLVSVIMPTYNRRNIIHNAIDSVLNQTYENFELIIIDDGSEDDTVEFINSIQDDRIRILCNYENTGCSFSRNQGLKNAKGEIIMYLDSDNIWDSKYVETMVGAFIELPDAAALYSGQYLFKNLESEHPYAIRFCSFNKLLLHNHNFIDLNCFCHKKYILNKIKGFDESLWRLVDWDLILRITNNFKVYSVPVLHSKYYEHEFEDRISNMPFKYYDACETLLSKNKVPIKEYNPLNKKVSIIIPSYESLDDIKECLNSIFSRNFDEMVDVIVVDNNSSTKVLEYLFNIESEGKIKLVLNSSNYGINYAIKKGIERADVNSDLLILDNDTIITEGAVEHMQYCAYSIPDCGLIVPHEMSSEESKVTTIHVPYAHPNFECDTLPSEKYKNITNLPIFHDGGLLELNYAPIFCTYIKREVYNKTLGLECELCVDNHMNRVFSEFIKNVLNLKIYQAPYSFVYHKHVVTTNKSQEFEAKILNNLKKDLDNEKPLWDF